MRTSSTGTISETSPSLDLSAISLLYARRQMAFTNAPSVVSLTQTRNISKLSIAGVFLVNRRISMKGKGMVESFSSQTS
jgi:hypothetical protein